ncbi:MAG TPA: radical SAM protein [Firmicutes bacterium]|nr:radical SAM protein [Bacillota bacterium]
MTEFVPVEGITPLTKKAFNGDSYYVLNPYKGCQYGCPHCTAQIPLCTAYPMKKWGGIVEVRNDIVGYVRKNSSRWAGRNIYLSSLGDPYQPAENKYKLTRALLEALASCDCSVRVITHSPLVIRDIDILSQMKDVSVGISLTTTNEFHAKLIEKNLPTSDERIETLYALSDSGIRTFLNIDPFLPEITPLFRLIDLFTDDVSFFRVAGPNWKATRVKRKLFDMLKAYEPELFVRYQTIYLKDNRYFQEIQNKIKGLNRSRVIETDISL